MQLRSINEVSFRRDVSHQSSSCQKYSPIGVCVLCGTDISPVRFVYKRLYVYASFSMCDVCFASMSACVAGEDAANDPVQIVNVYPPAVLRRHTLHPNEREEAHLGVSRLWQKSTIRTPYYRRVRLLTTPAHPNINYQEYKTRHLIPVHFQNSLSQWD